jgi:CHRD domain
MLKGRVKLAVLVAALAAMGVAGTVAVAGGGSSVSEELTGYEETPLAVSTTGNGSFKAEISRSQEQISFRLRYAELEGNVTQAHIHFGAVGQSGGISAFFCSNLGNGPEGTPPCPPAPATVSGTIEPEDVIGPAGQGIAAGEFDELVDAIRAGFTYANVHSSLYPAGEIRAQLEGDDDDRDDD